ncbi:MAG: DMT family transporter [Methylibium sp.]|uniref:DMT family transporter n=1 Tax=Methylibium sp. TaxID=2067992 RepID=UPI0017A65661|nr:DMT family transporter [Methylibium sp.]MBA3598256.1 DMT family transporter [Methylibium sp.]
MPAPLMMALATLLFALMGVCVKFASAHYPTGEIVFYRGVVGALTMAVLMCHAGTSLRTPVPGMHLWRSACGVTSLSLWFYAIGGLPLATAMTLNYMSSVWMALFLIGAALRMGAERVDRRLIATVVIGFVGVALILRPTIERDQLVHGLVGLVSGMLAAMAYLQVSALGRIGEPETRVVFYFSIGSMAAGLAITLPFTGLSTDHSLGGGALLLAVGVFATAAQLLMTQAYTRGRALVNASLQYLGIAYSFLFGVLLFDDPVTPIALAGIAMVIAAGLTATRLRVAVASQETARTSADSRRQ